MQVSWDNVNRTEVPGDYAWRDGVLEITQGDIDFWKEHPYALCNVGRPISKFGAQKRYRLAGRIFEDD